MNHITKEIMNKCVEYNRGFYTLSAESLGISVDELDEFIEEGQISVDKLLPSLAKKLTEIFEEHSNE